MPPEPWTTSASASLATADGVVTLVEGSAFCISNRAGEIDPEHPQGLIFRDTRFLSEFRLRLNGNVPEPLAATTPDPFSGVFVVRGHPLQGRADSHLLLIRRRYIGRGMREDIQIRNFGEEPAFCSVEMQLGADFADLFEVKEGRVQKHGKHTITDEHARLTFGYSRGPFRRATLIDFSELPRISGQHVNYEIIIPPRGIVVDLHAGDPCDRRPGSDAALSLRPPGRTVDAGRAARGVDPAAAEGHVRSRSVPSACSNVRRAISPRCGSSTPSTPTARSSQPAPHGS